MIGVSGSLKMGDHRHQASASVLELIGQTDLPELDLVSLADIFSKKIRPKRPPLIELSRNVITARSIGWGSLNDS
ncbi:MAG: hypothetical protein OEU92_34255 [Alphaproteobacteria bacterium]|nr:hypothetical protein [Alphaproteobacteria bacterium]